MSRSSPSAHVRRSFRCVYLWALIYVEVTTEVRYGSRSPLRVLWQTSEAKEAAPLICTSCHTDFEPGVKYCVTCGALLPLDEESVPFFTSIFREPSLDTTGDEITGDHAPVEAVTPMAAYAPALHASPPEPADTLTTLFVGEVLPVPRSANTPAVPVRIRRRSAVVAIILGAVALAMMFAVGFLVANLNGTPTAASAPTQKPPNPISTTQSALPTGVHSCSSDIGRNASTSCEFASNVAQAVWDAGDAEPLEVSAFSPVTNKEYLMTCSRGDWIRCSGGVGAVVYVRPT